MSSGWSALGQPIELRVHPAERTSNLCMTCHVCLFSDALTDKKMSLTAQSDLLSWDPCSGFELAEREMGVAQAEARTPCATSTWRFFFNCLRFQRGKLGSNRNREIFYHSFEFSEWVGSNMNREMEKKLTPQTGELVSCMFWLWCQE